MSRETFIFTKMAEKKSQDYVSLLSNLKNSKPDNSKQTTSAVSIISPKTTISSLREFIKHEQATASNIKNNTNRKSVLDALTRAYSIASSLHSIPNEGIAIFTSCYI
jgi:peptide subunit release factor 1 (eRF1)